MPKTQAMNESDVRERAVRRLAGMSALSVAVQAALFLILAALYRVFARLALDALANAAHGSPPAGADAIAATAVLALELFTALAIGFFAARRLLKAIVRATPHPMKPPTRPIPWMSLAAGGIVAVIGVLDFARQPLAYQDWSAWSVELARDAAIAVIFWYAAWRALPARRPA